MAKLTFKYLDESTVYPKLIEAINKLCADKNKDALCTSGYRSLEKQKIINKQSASLPDRIQRADGSVYDKEGRCWAAAFGKSNHNFCIALDITDEWFNKLTNIELVKYGLIKPVAHESWHVELTATRGLTQQQKEAIRDSVLNPKPVDELKEALEFICKQSGMDIDHWYKQAKETKYLDQAFIKIAKAWRKMI